MFDDLEETATLMTALDLVISAPAAVSIQAARLVAAPQGSPARRSD